jgi:uncharacterized protein (TIGR03032 family)
LEERLSTKTDETPRFAVTTSRQFASWLASIGSSLAVTTYQSGKILLFGTKPTGGLAIFERTLDRPMGLAVSGPRLAVAPLTQIVTFVDAAEATSASEPYDAVFIPQVAHFTGDLDVHDLAFDRAGRIVFVNTLFGCLARVSETHSFAAFWKPPFLSRLAAEDRCHLNGLAMRDGVPAYVTALSATDVTDGWRDHRRSGGIVVEVPSGEIVCRGLSMPHSPRLYEGALYVLNSGTGEFGRVDRGSGRFEPMAFLPGYGRGLSFLGRFAVIGLSEPRENRTFAGLALQERLEREGVGPRCGLAVVDLQSGDAVHWLRIEGVVRELYDVAVILGRRRPSLIGFKSDEIRRVISFDASGETNG